ncbi:MAG: SRPBCC domain-containing protein [Chloroflexota bacterium]
MAESATLVEWWVERGADGGTTLRLRESGFRRETHRSENEQGWTQELAELVELLGSS